MSKSKRLLLAAFGILCTASLVGICIWLRGMPLNLYTWIAISLCAASGATLALNVAPRRVFFSLSLLFCLYVAAPDPFLHLLPIENRYLFDDARSGWAYEMTPGMLFGRDGVNTEVLESYIGPIKSKWEHANYHSPHVRDGNERVQRYNVIHQEYFPAILKMLPDDEARRTVIRALTDTENRLRVHQSLLLAFLYDMNYPPGMNRESWWGRHKELFRSERDPHFALSLVQGWSQKIRNSSASKNCPSIWPHLRAADYQERGSWGGHYDMGEAYYGFVLPDARARELADRIVWWPLAFYSPQWP